MKAILQRVLSCSVVANGEDRGGIGKGLLVLLGVQKGDNNNDVKKLCDKVSNIRVFEDGKGKMNLSLKEISGDAMVVSNFTLCANVNSGRRPSFENSESPKLAENLYDMFCNNLSSEVYGKICTGVFGADMQVSLINDGPVTLILDTRE